MSCYGRKGIQSEKFKDTSYFDGFSQTRGPEKALRKMSVVGPGKLKVI